MTRQILTDIETEITSYEFIEKCYSVEFNSMFGPNVIEVELKANQPSNNIRVILEKGLTERFPRKKFSLVFVG